MSAPKTDSPSDPLPQVDQRPPARLRVWPAVLAVAAYWIFRLILGWVDIRIFANFFATVGDSLLLALCFSVWWLSRRAVSWTDRLLVFAGIFAGVFFLVRFGDPSVGAMGAIFFVLPFVISVLVGWLTLTRNSSPAARRNGALAFIALAWAANLFIRIDGVDGNARADMGWRWSKTAEDLYLAERAQTKSASDARVAGQTGLSTNESVAPVTLAAGDWPEFRGPDRLGKVTGFKVATNWSAAPPKQLWRQRIGPGWSSMLVIGDRLFTHEQRGDFEVLVCLDASTGRERWVHQDKVRFYDGQAGAGPRSTPAFSDGRIFSFGGTGVLNCVDAGTGALKWSRDVAAEFQSAAPMWGFSSSPLICDGKVIVYAGLPKGKKEGILAAYATADGKPAWSFPTGPVSYSSPQIVRLDGKTQVLLLSDQGLAAVSPAAGELLWNYAALGSQMWRVAQPCQVGESSILFGSEDLGLTRLEIKHDQSGWTPSVAWTSKSMGPAYNDFIYSDGFVYGFDGGIFCCVDAKTGERRWKGGRYGHGQVILIADQRLLAVISESGEVVLVAATPEKHRELGRLQVLSGKTWNHPVIAHGRLFVRNGEEIAAYELTPEDAVKTTSQAAAN